jgi:hypothetical protein
MSLFLFHLIYLQQIFILLGTAVQRLVKGKKGKAIPVTSHEGL